MCAVLTGDAHVANCLLTVLPAPFNGLPPLLYVLRSMISRLGSE